ncbi:PLP-dependent aminotransferase family protein [Streptomyces rectiverticillatus]|uniref:MocR-like pyridoxine biosynthesis transcription factor PdxR n=1 Tax=Streptomyces rectiverticillatus TaxID=173860 RepID=UPI0015C3396C|nr:PLP-dependent aminotransferase family protein [Streptomyces rectiverticillatus]QLE75716.1 PLP-dependent aminotransferase family protein [Streptomyces rectiverticillatus]
MDLHLDLDQDASLPLNTAVADAIRHAIRTGRLRAPDPLPSTRALAAQLAVARGTVTEAYAQLAAEGWIITRQGATTRVARDGDGPPATVEPPAPSRTTAPACWDLRPGVPDTTLFPARTWATAVRAATRSDPEVLGYGEPQGRPELRRVLAGYLNRTRGVTAGPDRILITSGFADALALLATTLRELGLRHIAMEDPCLDVHRRVVTHAGLTIHPVPVDAHGLDITALAATPARVVLATPAHQFPLGATLGPARRRKLVAWARRVDGYIIEDDYDGEYRFDRKPVSALQALDPSRVIYGGTTSKTLAPAMRLGWLALPPRLSRPVTDRVAHQQAPPLDQLALSHLILSGHYDRHIRRTRTEYRRRRDHLIAAGLPLTGIAAGLHALLPVADEEQMIAHARTRSLALMGLGPFWHGRPRGQGLIIGYSRPPVTTAYEALDHLVALMAPADVRPG